MFHRLKRVLIVDDGAESRNLLESALAQHELEVVSADNGVEAIQFLIKYQVDLIVSEFRMPVSSGVDLLNWCRKHRIHYPVIFTTAEVVLLPSEELALKDCCTTLLKKPVDPILLSAALDASDRYEHHLHCMSSSLKLEFAQALGRQKISSMNRSNTLSS